MAIPLPALNVQYQPSESLTDQYGKVISLRNLMQQGQLHQEQLKGAQLENVGREQENTVRARDIQDQQTVMDTLGKHNGDIDAALPELGSKVSPKTFMGLKKYQLEVKQKIAAINKDELPVLQDQNNRLQGLIQQVSQLPDEQYIQQWPQIAAAAKEIKPDLKMDLSQPIPKQQLAIFGLQSLTLGNAIEKQKAADDAKSAAAKLPGEIANSQKAVKVNAGTNALGITAAEQARNALTRRGQDIQQQKKDVNEQTIEQAAQLLAGGDMTRLRDIASLRGDQRLLIYTRAKQINPNFSPSETDRRIKMEDSITNGKDGQQLQSFGTFLEHGGEASTVVDSIRATDSKIINRPLNWWRNNVSGNENYIRLVAALEPVRKEFEGFLLGGHALYADDRKAAETILSDDSSPAQIQAALKQMGHTAKARFNEINYRYSRVMHKDIDSPFSPEAIAGAKRIGVELGGSSQSAAQSKVLSMSQIQQAARDHGVSVDEAKRQAIAQGYTVQ